MKHRGRDNVGGVVIGGDPIVFEELPEHLQFLESIIELSSLAFTESHRGGLLTLKEVTEQFILFWADEDSHPDHASPDRTTSSFSTKNCRIMPRIMKVAPI